MSDANLSPAPWRQQEVFIPSQDAPVVLRIIAADETRVCDVAIDASINGPGLDRARANAAFICAQRLAV